MALYNGRGGKLSKTRANQRCDGCGCICPQGSRMLIWQVWRDGFRDRVRFCLRCRDVINGCDDRRRLDYDADDLMVRDMCERCDSFPFCEKVEYLREEMPGDLYFGGLEMPTAEE